MNTLSLSPLRLERHYFDRIQVESLPDREKGAEVGLEVEIAEGQHTNGTLRFRVTLQVIFGPKNGSKIGYRGDVSAVGYFGVREPCSLERAKELVDTEGVELLFGAIRELVCNLTSRGPWPILRLPNVALRDAAEPKFSPKKLPPRAVTRSGGKKRDVGA